MFETFKVHHMNVHADAVLALYSTGRRTGVVVDVGHTAGRVVPVYDGSFISSTLAHIGSWEQFDPVHARQANRGRLPELELERRYVSRGHEN